VGGLRRERKHSLVPNHDGRRVEPVIGTYLQGHGTIVGLSTAPRPTLRAHNRAGANPDFKLSEERILLGVAGGHGGSQDAYLP